MGGSVSCLCSDQTLDEVQVMNVDGKLFSFKEGTTIRAVLDENPFHKVVLCGRERTVLPDSSLLSCHRFYFLLPVGHELNDENFGRLLRLVLGKESYGKLGKKLEAEMQGKGGSSSGKNLKAEGDGSKNLNNRWKPELETILEGDSPATTLGRLGPAEVRS